MKRVLLSLAVVGISVAAAQAQVKKSTVEGITNFAQVETTVACAGAVKPGSVARIKDMGFASIINLRLPTEPGADIDAEAAEAKAAGINFRQPSVQHLHARPRRGRSLSQTNRANPAFSRRSFIAPVETAPRQCG